MSTLEASFSSVTGKGDPVARAESAEASLNSRFLQAQAAVTNKLAAVSMLETQAAAQVSTSESRAVGVVASGNTAVFNVNEASETVAILSKMVRNNDQNVVVAVSKTFSGIKKTADQAKASEVSSFS